MWRPYAGAIAAIGGGFGVSALACKPNSNTSPLQPPDWVFPVVWTTLFGLQGAVAASSGLKLGVITIVLLALEYAWSFVYCASKKASSWLMIPMIGLALYMLTEDSTLANITGAGTAAWILFAQQLLATDRSI